MEKIGIENWIDITSLPAKYLNDLGGQGYIKRKGGEITFIKEVES